MTTIEVKHLLKYNRFTENEWKFITLLCYLPVGIILFLLRGFLALVLILLGSILPDSPLIRKVFNKITCVSLGISISIENIEKKEHADVYVSNSLSIFDNLVVHNATGAASTACGIQPSFAKILGIYNFGSSNNLENYKEKVTAFIKASKLSVYFAPEDKITNGRALLKFKSYPFAIASKVQPVCLSVERPLLDISVYSLGSTFWTDLFFYMFSPLTSYKLKFLACLEKKSLSDEEFAEVARQSMASALKIEAVDITSEDLIEWEKRQLAEQNRIRSEQTHDSMGNSTLRRMALQVKEVLPHVPIDVISKDLYRTRSIDNTITNILEGRIRFIPETQSTSNSFSNTSSSSIYSSGSSVSGISSINTSSSSSSSMFLKSAHDRSKSFQERKEQLIADARKRYIEKHNIVLPS